MCEFLSAVITIPPVGRHTILCADMTSHSGTAEALGLSPDTYRELEWTRDDPKSLVVRVAPGDRHTESALTAEALAQYPRRIDLINECARQVVAFRGSLDLRALTSAEGLTLPQSIGGSLYLPHKVKVQR